MILSGDSRFKCRVDFHLPFNLLYAKSFAASHPHTPAGDHSPAGVFNAATSGNAVNQVQFTCDDFGLSIQSFQKYYCRLLMLLRAWN